MLLKELERYINLYKYPVFSLARALIYFFTIDGKKKNWIFSLLIPLEIYLTMHSFSACCIMILVQFDDG